MRFVYDVVMDVVGPFTNGGAMEPPVNVNIKAEGCRPFIGATSLCCFLRHVLVR
jgi:hypothetical protein